TVRAVVASRAGRAVVAVRARGRAELSALVRRAHGELLARGVRAAPRIGVAALKAAVAGVVGGAVALRRARVAFGVRLDAAAARPGRRGSKAALRNPGAAGGGSARIDAAAMARAARHREPRTLSVGERPGTSRLARSGHLHA